MRNTLNALAIVGLIACSVALAGDEPDSAKTPDKAEKSSLRPALKSGMKIPMCWKSTSGTSASAAYSGMSSLDEVMLVMQANLFIDKAGDDGSSVSLCVDRISGRAKLLDQTVEFDTEKMDTCRRPDGGDSYIAVMKAAIVAAELDKLGRLKKASPPADLTKKLTECFKNSKAPDELAKTTIDMMAQLADECFAYLPDDSVAVGSTWQVKKSFFYIDFYGVPTRIQEDSECKLLRIETRPEGRIALVQVSGTCTIPDRDPKSEIAEYAVAGAMRVNLDKPMAIRWSVKRIGRLKGKDDSDILTHTISTEFVLGDDAKASSQPANSPTSRPAIGPSTRP